MTGPVAFGVDDDIATITLDDGKVNALSPTMLQAIDDALSSAAGDDAEMAAMVRQGFELAHRILSFPKPVVVAGSGHAMAMGAFLLLTGDYRIGVARALHRIVANEVAIGIVMPRAAIEICRQRLTPAALERAVGQSEQWHPGTAAIDAGWIDALERAIADDDAELRGRS